MKKSLSFLIVAVLFFSLAGCQEQQSKKSSELERRADLKLSCVAEFLRSDGSRYLTEQRYEIFSSSKEIILTSKEPFGDVIWSVQNGGYTVQKGLPDKVFDKELYRLMMDKDIADGLLEIYIAGLFENPAAKTEKESLNFDGKIYGLVRQTGSGVNVYSNKATGKLDLVTSGRNKTGKVYLIHGFNYQKIKGQNGFYPSRLDIYRYRADFDKELIAQIDCF